MKLALTRLARGLGAWIRRPVHRFKTQATQAYITCRATLESGQGGRTRFSGVAYSGGVVPSYGWLGDIAIDLSGLRNDGAQVPVLADHGDSIDAIAGIGRVYRTTGADGITQLAIEGELYDTEAGNKIASLLQEGFPLQMSVGIVSDIKEVAAPITVNGQEVTVQAVFERPLVREVSFVPVGADPDTSAAIFSHRPAGPQLKESAMPPEPKDQAEALEALRAELKAAHETIDTLKAELDEARKQRRQSELAALFREIGRELPEDTSPYLSMDDTAFQAFAADLKAMAEQRPAQDPSLFRAQSPSMAQDPGANPNPDAGKALLDAVATLSGQQNRI